MNNHKYGFSGNGGTLSVKALPYDDSQVSLADTFSITYDGNGFVIKPYGYTTAISTPADTSVFGEELEMLNPSSAGDRCKWNLVRYTGLPMYGMSIYEEHNELENEGVTAGETLSVKITAFSTVLQVNEPHVTIDSSTASKATVSWSSATQTATIFGRDDDLATLNISIRNASGNVVYTHVRDFYIDLPIHEGVFYLQNKELGNYMQIDDGDASNNYQSNGAFMELHEYTGDDYQRWRFEHDIDGYYIISSVISGKVLTVPQGEENDSGEALTQTTDGFVERQRWKFEKTASGSFIIRPKSGEGYATDWCMSAGTGIGSNGRNVEHRAYTNNGDYKDEWLLTYCSDFAFVFWGAYLGDPQIETTLNSVTSVFASSGAKGWATVQDAPPAQVLQQLNDAEIFAILTHGNQAVIALRHLMGTDTIKLTLDDINALPSDSLKNAKLVCLFCCDSGFGRENADNFANAIYAKGAKTVISFDVTIHSKATYDWAQIFLIEIANKKSIEDAADTANDVVNKGTYDQYLTEETTPANEENQYFLGDLTAVPNE